MNLPKPSLPSSGAIQRRALHDEIIEKLRDMISEGELPPGTRVPEKVLCLRFGVSRTPLREALKVLGSEGLVDLLPNRGATVARLTLDDIEEMFPVMGQLEALAGELACQHATDEEIAEIRLLHSQMVLDYTRSNRSAYFKVNQEIHGKILRAARNQTLCNVHRALAGRVRHARYLANLSQVRWAKAVEEHEQILAALTARDGARLSAILKQHLANKLEVVRESLLGEGMEKGGA
ncbi:GntR family transcriptional regulator [Taklimakanibacter deserti]|uniref:GntR family transcriptional regulator n=1 Tax=Taklimakanibacter deserti TaxID=2267839 RepID=UPI000E65BB55